MCGLCDAPCVTRGYFCCYDVEFGFEFRIIEWEGYGYSSVFWSAEDSAREKVNDISIVMDGSRYNPSLSIKVNGKDIVSEADCGSYYQHNWEQDDKIRVKIRKTGAYSNKLTKFYARKSDTDVWDCLLDETNGDHELYLDRSYVEYGFEFDIVAGRNWPYNDVFWTAEDSAREKVWDIHIEMNGITLWPGIFISVNCKTLVDEQRTDNGSEHYFRQHNKIRVTILKLYTNKTTRISR